MLRNVSADQNLRFEVNVERGNVLTDSFKAITNNEPGLFYGGIKVTFVKRDEHGWILDLEEGIGDGVAREWFLLVSKTFTDKYFSTCSDDPHKVYMKVVGQNDEDPRILYYFRFFGRFLALALMHGVHLGIKLDSSLFLPLAGQKISVKDIGDPGHYGSLQKILEYAEDRFQDELKDLFPNVNVDCSNKSKEECLDLCVQHKYVDSASNRLEALRKGFSELLICQGNEGAKEFFGDYSAEEFNKVLYGSGEPLCIEDWKQNTQYEVGLTTSLFWEVVTEFSEERRRDLFQFWTSMKNLPHGGFDGLEQKLTILVVDGSRLPAVSTCVHQLKIMAYESKEELKKDIEFAIDYSTGFFIV